MKSSPCPTSHNCFTCFKEMMSAFFSAVVRVNKPSWVSASYPSVFASSEVAA